MMLAMNDLTWFTQKKKCNFHRFLLREAIFIRLCQSNDILQHNRTILWMRRGILILTFYICNSTTHLIAILRFRKKTKKLCHASFCYKTNRVYICICVGGILWIQGHSKNGPASMAFFGWKFLQIVLTKVCKNFQPDTPVYISSKKAFIIFFMKWEEGAIT